MGEREITRRKLLAGAVAVGGTGVTVGTGTATVLSDSQPFSDTTVSAGTFDLAVDWSTDDASGSSTGGAAIPLSLSPDDPSDTVGVSVSLPTDRSNNPGYAWMGAVCPADDDLLERLQVTVRYADCDGDCTVFEGTLAELGAGTHIDGTGESVSAGDQACLQPGSPVDLAVEVELDPYGSGGTAEIEFVFVATQCRKNEPTNPFPAADTGCPTSTGETEEAFSFIGFCTDADAPIDPELSLTEWDGGDLPAVEWETEAPVDFVVVKKATVFTVYDYRDDTASDGVAAWKDPEATEPSYGMDPGDPGAYVSVAKEAVGADGYAPAKSTKLEWEDGDWGGSDDG